MPYQNRDYNRNNRYGPNNGAGGKPSTLLVFEHLDPALGMATIETYDTSYGRRSAFSVYKKVGAHPTGGVVWERVERLANLEPAKALMELDSWKSGERKDVGNEL